jgi:ubiquinone/menaquinone biosynthesis methyltransferase
MSTDTLNAGIPGNDTTDGEIPDTLQAREVRALFDRVAPGGEAIGCDFSPAMLARARTKAPGLRFEHGDALALDYPDDSFDAATVAFGARNFADLQQGLTEMTRVVRPGGRVVMLDFTTPQRPPFSTFFSIWFDRIVPTLGRLAGARQAYGYLTRSVQRFPSHRDGASVRPRRRRRCSRAAPRSALPS